MDKSSYREDQWYHRERILIVCLRVVVSLLLLAAGITILALRIPGWGIILGLPIVIFGSVFLIYTYDEVLSRQVDLHNSKHHPKDDPEE